MIIAVDPGKNTGWCLYDPEDGLVHLQQDLDQQHVCAAIYETLMAFEVDAIVCESFTVTGSRVVKFQPYSLEIIGFLRWLATRNGIPFVEQSPRDAKKIGSDDRIKAWGKWRSATPHANDAQRHAFLYGVRQGWINPLEVDARAS